MAYTVDKYIGVNMHHFMMHVNVFDNYLKCREIQRDFVNHFKWRLLIQELHEIIDGHKGSKGNIPSNL